MQVQAHLMMVMVLDKCLGCHTCSVTCKQAWTNRDGVDYVWFNNVETKPGSGYPKRWEDQAHWRGGWKLDRRGRLKLRAGGRGQKLITIFGNFDLPAIDDYYEPWTYDYAKLIDAPLADGPPVATARSRITGRPMDLRWGPNWEDNLAGVKPADDPAAAGLERELLGRYEEVFLFYLPRICNHCLNPSCVASCPSGAMYKRASDGLVLVDQDKCRAWRFCVSGCPYKKVYFNPVTTKAEKCIFCYAGVTEDGLPTICSDTCVGRIRYLGVVLYDLEAVTTMAETAEETDLVEAHRQSLLDPHDPAVVKQAETNGIPYDWIEAARRSPVYALAKDLRVALPLHPEYRTLPMVWYVPPLSPLLSGIGEAGYDPEDPVEVFGAVDDMRIPMQYVANILAAGDTAQIDDALRRLTAMRTYMRRLQLTGRREVALAQAVDMRAEQLEQMYRLLAVASREDRYVIPKARFEAGAALQSQFRGAGGRGGAGRSPTAGPGGLSPGRRGPRRERRRERRP